jgi:hypothetical protein
LAPQDRACANFGACQTLQPSASTGLSSFLPHFDCFPKREGTVRKSQKLRSLKRLLVLTPASNFKPNRDDSPLAANSTLVLGINPLRTQKASHSRLLDSSSYILRDLLYQFSEAQASDLECQTCTSPPPPPKWSILWFNGKDLGCCTQTLES